YERELAEQDCGLSQDRYFEVTRILAGVCRGSVETLFPSLNANSASRLDLHHVGRLEPFGALADSELNGLTFVERLVALFLNRTMVNEYVGSRTALDETIALLIVKPLHYALFFHAFLFL